MKIALVQDWFVVNGGAEKVVREIIRLYPGCDVFALVDFLDDHDRQHILAGKKTHTSFLQRVPFVEKHYRNLLAFFPRAIESLDLSAYDLILSSSYAVAKGVKKLPGQLHICYCHSPVRYVWDLEQAYLDTLSAPARMIAKPIFNYIRAWDLRTTERVDYFIANSKNVAERIRRIYNRDSEIIYPPVDTALFTPCETKDDYYFTTLRVVPYKKLDLIVETFNRMPERKLIVSGDGPGLDKIRRRAASNVTFVGFVAREKLVSFMQRARAFVLAAEEDFGITSLEAQSCCTPVIAYRKGGYLETVIEGKTGVFFEEQTVESLTRCIDAFEKHPTTFRKEDFTSHVSRFSAEKFRERFKQFMDTHVEATRGKT
jgi:glycosyltransferase involved in cell wall biosynthesis